MLFQTLPKSVRKLADKNYELLKANPSHPSLHSKRLESTGLSESDYNTELWPLKQAMICCGFGLVLIQSMTS
jgi:hypothetical protein